MLHFKMHIVYHKTAALWFSDERDGLSSTDIWYTFTEICHILKLEGTLTYLTTSVSK